MVLDKLKRYVSGMDSPTEAGSPRNGAFSYAAEWHAFSWGVGLGLGLILALRFAPDLAGALGSALVSLVAYAYSDRRQKAKDAPVPAYVVKQSEQEPHYLSGGIAIGLLLGGVVVFATILL